MDIYTCQCLIEDLDLKIVIKQHELDQLRAVNDNSIVQNAAIQTLQYEVNEMMNQRAFYSDYVRERLMSNCDGGNCARCCRNKFF